MSEEVIISLVKQKALEIVQHVGGKSYSNSLGRTLATLKWLLNKQKAGPEDSRLIGCVKRLRTGTFLVYVDYEKKFKKDEELNKLLGELWQALNLRALIDFLIRLCDPKPGWIKGQIKIGRKVRLVGKDIQLLIDMFQNHSTFKQAMNIWLAVVDEIEDEVKTDPTQDEIEDKMITEPTLRLVWLDDSSNSINDSSWKWVSRKSSTLPYLKILMYGCHSPHHNILKKGIVPSMKDIDDTLTTLNAESRSATTSYFSLNMDSSTPFEVNMPVMGDHPPADSLTLQCYTTPTTSVQLPIRLSFGLMRTNDLSTP